MKPPFYTLSLLTLAIVCLPLASAISDFEETFQDETVPTAPSGEFYTFTTSGSGSFGTTNSWPITSPTPSISYLQNDTAAGTTARTNFNFDDPFNLDLCSPPPNQRMEYSFRLSALPTAGNAFVFALEVTEGTGPDFRFDIIDTGELTLGYSATSVSTGFNFAAKTWYNMSVELLDCGELSPTAQMEVLLFDQEVSFGLSAAELCNSCEYGNFYISTGNVANVGGIHIDNLGLVDVDVPPQGIDANAVSDPINEISGFDLDQSGSNIIVRFDNVPPGPEGRDVLSLEALSLERQDGGHIDTECDDMEHGVMAHQNALMFVKCDDGDPTHFWIRNPGLGTLEDNCGDECPADIDMGCCGSVSNAGGDDVNELYELTAFPIDWSRRSTANFGVDRAAIAMGYSSTNGIIGVQLFDGGNNAQDYWTFDEVGFSGSVAPDQICIAEDDGIFYLQAVDGQATTKFYRIDFRPLDANAAVLTPELVSVATLPSMSPASGLSCAGDRTLIGVEKTGAGVNDQLYLIDRATGTPIWSKTYPDGDVVYEGSLRGVALSGDGLFFAYTNEIDGLIYVGDAADGLVTGQIPLESGSIVGMEFDFSAQNLYVAYNDGANGAVYRYSMVDAGLVPPTNTIGGEGGAPLPTDGPSGEGPLGGAPAQVGGSLGIGTFGGGLFLAALTILMFATAAFNDSGNVKLFGYVGAIVGFFVAWGFRFISTGAVFAIIVICALIWYAGFRGSSSGG